MKLFENKRAIEFERSPPLFFFFSEAVASVWMEVYVPLRLAESSCILFPLVLGAAISRSAQKCGPRLIYFGSDPSNSWSKISSVHTTPSYPLISAREAADILEGPQFSVPLGKIQNTLSFHAYGTARSQKGLLSPHPSVVFVTSSLLRKNNKKVPRLSLNSL